MEHPEYDGSVENGPSEEELLQRYYSSQEEKRAATGGEHSLEERLKAAPGYFWDTNVASRQAASSASARRDLAGLQNAPLNSFISSSEHRFGTVPSDETLQARKDSRIASLQE